MSGNKNESYHYHYPDHDEVLAKPRDDHYWSRSEYFLLNTAIAEFFKNNKTNKTFRFLDAGCGDGRLLHYFAPFFDRIDAIDPDVERLNEAARRALYWNIKEKIDFYDSTIESMQESDSYDFVFCNHVVEHLHPQTVDAALNTIRKLLTENGILLITTAHSQEAEDYFMASYRDNNGEMKSERLNIDGYNSLTRNPEDGKLPVHKRTVNSFSSELKKQGFKIISHRVYQVPELFGELDNIFFRDTVVNLIPSLQDRLGQNMAFICCR